MIYVFKLAVVPLSTLSHCKRLFLHFVLIFKQNNKLIILLCNLFLTVDDLFFSWGILFSYYLLFI